MTPLANILTVNEYKMGEYLIKEGEYPDKFMVVATGQCKAVIERLVERNAEPSIMLKGRVNKQRRFDFAGNHLDAMDKVKELRKEEPQEEFMEGYINSVDPESKKHLKARRFFEHEPISSDSPNKITYKKHVTFFVLKIIIFF